MQKYPKCELEAKLLQEIQLNTKNQDALNGFILPERAVTDWGAWGTFLTAVESSRGIGDTVNFPGALAAFARIAYRLFWNQFHTYKKYLN